MGQKYVDTMRYFEPKKFLHSCNPPDQPIRSTLSKTTSFTRGDSFHWPWRNFFNYNSTWFFGLYCV